MAFDIAVGRYKLTNTLANPLPDRRWDNWSDQNNFEDGNYVVIADDADPTIKMIISERYPNAPRIFSHLNPERFDALAAALVPIGDNLRSLFIQYDGFRYPPWVVVGYLILQGTITLAQVRAALIAVKAG